VALTAALGVALGPVPAAPAYRAGYDRTVAGSLSVPPNGSVTSEDIVRVVFQFGNSRIGPP